MKDAIEALDGNEGPEAQKEAVDLLEGLTITAGWTMYTAWGTESIRRDMLQLVQPLDSRDAVLQQEYLKGRIAGVQMALNAPSQMVEMVRMQRKEENAQLNEEDADGN